MAPIDLISSLVSDEAPQYPAAGTAQKTGPVDPQKTLQDFAPLTIAVGLRLLPPLSTALRSTHWQESSGNPAGLSGPLS